MGYVKCANCGKEVFVVSGIRVEKCKHCKKSLYVCEETLPEPDYKSCEHQWKVRERSPSGSPTCSVCKVCHAMCRVYGGCNHYFSADGVPFTYFPTEGEGEKALESVDNEIEQWKKGQS